MYYESIKNMRAIRYGYYFLKGVIQRKKYKLKAEETLNSFGITFEDSKRMKSVISDMAWTKTFKGFEFDEYLYYKFYDKDKKERLCFVADWEHLGYTCKMNNYSNDDLFDNKWKTYNKFKQYYLRDVMLYEGPCSRAEFYSFIEEKKSFVVKPLNASCGKGVQVIERSSYDSDATLEQMLSKEYGGQFIVEELIVQSHEMAKFHPASVNTVRIPTIRLDDETIIVHPFMRIGQHGKSVDNGGAGGIICAVDVDTGKLFAAADESGNTFDVHPESREMIIGFEIPFWDEAKKLVKELATVVPDNRYTGWDVALTSEGWKLVEANRRGQFIWQIPMQVGFRKEINSILKRMGRKY